MGLDDGEKYDSEPDSCVDGRDWPMTSTRFVCIKALIVYSLLINHLAASDHDQKKKRPFLEQPGCPMVAVQTAGPSLTVKNVSEKEIVRFVMACMVQHVKTYRVVDTYKSEEGATPPGGFSTEGWMDATPLNACRSWNGVLAIASVRFADGSSWESSLVKKSDLSHGEVKK